MVVIALSVMVYARCVPAFRDSASTPRGLQSEYLLFGK
jgi:hypothetical protein